MEKRIPDPSEESPITECLQGLLKGEICSAFPHEQLLKHQKPITNMRLIQP